MVQQHVGITMINLDESMYMHICIDTLSDFNKKYYFWAFHASDFFSFGSDN